MRFSLAALLAPALLVASVTARFVIYADEWHPTRPTNSEDRAGVDHVVLAFAMANSTATYQPKVPISTIKSEFPSAKVMIAVGGWGDDIGFYQVSQTDATIKQFAADVATMLTNTGADGVDIDWEYPGGNGANYKDVDNMEKAYQIEAFPKVLAAIRATIGDKLLSIAVPGKKGDMMGYTKITGPKIWPSVDYINVMSYDLMNRRDQVTKHHSSVTDSLETIQNYLDIEAPPEKINLGFAYYAKYFTTQGDCTANPIGCPIVLAEDPITGNDLLTSGAYTFEPAHMTPVDPSNITTSYDGTCGPATLTKCASGCCSQYGNCGVSPEHCSGACQHAFGTGCTDPDVAGSWQKALKYGKTDEKAGGQYYFDAENTLFWTWDTPELISRKFKEILRSKGLGGVMAWSLGEDSFDWSHVRRMAMEDAKGEANTQTYQAPPKSTPNTYPPQAESGPVAGEAPAIEGTAPKSSEKPYNVVWVDGTQDGPDSDLSAESGAPKYYVNHEGPGVGMEMQGGQEEASTPQQIAPLPKVAPAQEVSAPAPSPAPEVAQSATQPSTSGPDDELPFSPEYLAAMGALGASNASPKSKVPVQEMADIGTGRASSESKENTSGPGSSCRLKKRARRNLKLA